MSVLVGLALAAGLIIGLLGGVLATRPRRRVVGPAPAAPARVVGRTEPADIPALVVQSLAGGVVVVDRDEFVVLSNPAAHTLGAVVDDRVATDELRAVVRTALDANALTSRTVPLVARKGREAGSIAVTAVPLPAPEGGRVAAVALLLDDVTEARRLENVRRDFVANVSHELKTPVGALTLLAEAVQDAADDPEAIARFAARMQHESQRLGRLVQELIALSRVQGADALPDPDPVEVRSVVDEAVDVTHLAADANAITVTTRVQPGLRVPGNATQLATALSNLIDNAVSYSPRGTRVAVIARAAGAPDVHGEQWAEIAVTDQGIGIAEADLDRVFERFFRVDPARSRATGGTGLGLAIVKHIVTNHGGRVDVWSVEGAGSTFTVRLPLLPAAEPDADPAEPAPSRPSVRAPRAIPHPVRQGADQPTRSRGIR